MKICAGHGSSRRPASVIAPGRRRALQRSPKPALPIEGLVLTKLAVKDHRQQL
jgi:hypothetical protein